MPPPPSFFAPRRRNLFADSRAPAPVDPFRPLSTPRRAGNRRSPLALDDAVGPGARNRPLDVIDVERALRGAGVLPRPPGGRYDGPLRDGIRAFQRRYGLKADGLLNPDGPTARTLGAVARPVPKAPPELNALATETVAANGRLVRHMMTTKSDGLVPRLIADDFRLDDAGRAKAADFLAQLFAADPARARSLRAQAKKLLAERENLALDRLILARREADEEPPENPPGPFDPDDPGTTPDGPSDDAPPYDPDHPRPSDPDDPDEDEPDQPEKPEKPKPDEDKCAQLRADLANAEQAAKEAAERMREAAEKYNEKSREMEAHWQELLRKAAAVGVSILSALNDLRRGRTPRGITLPSDAEAVFQAYKRSREEADQAINERRVAEAERDSWEAKADAIRRRIEESGCG